MSVVDADGHVLRTFTDVCGPYHLAVVDYSGQVIVADTINSRILLLDDQLYLETVLVALPYQLSNRRPDRLHYHRRSSRLYVLHGGSGFSEEHKTISEFILE